jgi:hypothetical protein
MLLNLVPPCFRQIMPEPSIQQRPSIPCCFSQVDIHDYWGPETQIILEEESISSSIKLTQAMLPSYPDFASKYAIICGYPALKSTMWHFEWDSVNTESVDRLRANRGSEILDYPVPSQQ